MAEQAIPSLKELDDHDEIGRAVRNQVSLWLDCRLGECIHVSAGNGWVLEAYGELHQRRGAPGLYRVGDALLDLNGIEEATWFHQTGEFSGAEQFVVGLDNGIALTVTTAE